MDFYESNVQDYSFGLTNVGLGNSFLRNGVTATALVWAKTQNLPDGAHSVKLFTNGGDFQVKFEKMEKSLNKYNC